MYVVPLIKYEIFGANERQWLAPIDFGIISVNIRMRSVNTMDAIPKYSFPKTTTACAPTPAAPMVLANVLRARMAAMDLSMIARKVPNL